MPDHRALMPGMTMNNKSFLGRTCPGLWGALAAALYALPAPALPSYGVEDCTLCHVTPQSGMTLSNFQTRTNLGAGLFKVFQVTAGGTAAIQYGVTNDNGGYYALNFNGPTNSGVNNSADQLSYTPDAAWTSQASGAYFTVGPVTNSPTVWAFNLGITASTPPDLYLVKTLMAGIDSTLTAWSQVEFFYVQVMPAALPEPAMLQPRRLGSTFSVDVATTSGLTYYLEYKASPAEASWTPASQVSGDGSVKTLTDGAASGPQRFYHLRVE